MTRYCPRDGGTFEDWVTTCPDCGTTLVADRPAAPAPTRTFDPSDRIVSVARVANEPLAQLWRQVLADEGIRGVVKPSGPGFGGWGSVANLEHELLVLESTLPRARRILHELQRGQHHVVGRAATGGTSATGLTASEVGQTVRRHPRRRPVARPASRPRSSAS